MDRESHGAKWIHSRRLSEWELPVKEFTGFFHHFKIIYAFRGPKENGKQEKITFFYDKDSGHYELEYRPFGWVESLHFLNYTMKFGRDLVINKMPSTTRVLENGTSISLVTMRYTSRKFGTQPRQEKKLLFYVLHGSKQSFLPGNAWGVSPPPWVGVSFPYVSKTKLF